MKTRTWSVVLLAGCLFAGRADAEIVKQDELQQEFFGPSDYRAGIKVAVGSYCINGYEFVILYGVGAGGGSGAGGTAAVSQVYEERGGRALPKRCGTAPSPPWSEFLSPLVCPEPPSNLK